jgi:polyisoprenyl-phosphate glycosyltransferase
MTQSQSPQQHDASGVMAKVHVLSRYAARGGNQLLSIVVALYNEEKAIPAFFEEVERVTRAIDSRVEYVCVNDGSCDRTLELLRERLASNPRIHIIDLARNFGKEAAITAGLAHAKGDAIVIMDADLQDPPALIPILVAKWREGYDVVYGIRSCRNVDSTFKRWTAKVFYAVFNRMTDLKIPPGAGDFRLLDRRVVNVLLSLPERNRFMKGLFSWVGFQQTGVEYVRQPRIAGSSAWSYPRLANLAIDGLTSFSVAPLRIAGLAGLTVSLFGFCYAVYLIIRTLIFGLDFPAYGSMLLVIMFLGGLQLVCLGVIGEYLGRLYIEAKGRPLYVVANVIERPDLVSEPALSDIGEPVQQR